MAADALGFGLASPVGQRVYRFGKSQESEKPTEGKQACATWPLATSLARQIFVVAARFRRLGVTDVGTLLGLVTIDAGTRR